ncbi:MAG: hypothetical protein J6K31_01105 [Parabacteroides sp.]|nr:hypothetical protein [Parabacteroides sp.]
MNRRYIDRLIKTGAWLLMSLFLCLPTAWGQGLTVTGGTSGTDYTYTDNIYTVQTNQPLTFSGETTTDRIVVAEGVAANVTLNGASITFSDGQSDHKETGTCAFEIKNGAAVTLTISATNSLQSGASKAAIQVEKGASIQIEGNGTLTAQGGWGGAGIGAGDGTTCGTIRIKSGTVNAYAGDWAFGLGGGCFLRMEPFKEGILIIDGGNVTAGGKEYGSSGIMGNITLNGGSITTSCHERTTYKTISIGNITIGDSSTSTIENWTIEGSGVVKRGTFTDCTFTGGMTLEGGTFTNCTFTSEMTLKGGTFSDCTFSGETILKDGTFTDCSFDKIISIDEKISIINTKSEKSLTFIQPVVTLTQQTFQGCTINGTTIFVQGTTFTDCKLEGNITLYNGSSSGKTSIAGSKCTIYGGEWQLKSDDAAINSSIVYIHGGRVIAEGGQGGAGIGGNGTQNGKTVYIYGGYVEAIGGYGAGIGGGDGYGTNGKGRPGNTYIYGGTVYASSGAGSPIGGGRGASNEGGVTIIEGGSVHTRGYLAGNFGVAPKDNAGNPLYLATLENITDVNSVTVDEKSYHIDTNHNKNNNIYLYLTNSEEHTVVVRNNSGEVTTYKAICSGDNKFTFEQQGETTTPTEVSTIQFSSSAISSVYGEVKPTVSFTLKETGGSSSASSEPLKAGMGIVKMVVKDSEGNVCRTYRFDAEAAATEAPTIDLSYLDAGTYKLYAQYGGSETSLPSEVEVQSIQIIPAAGIYAPEYEDPMKDPTNLQVTYGQDLKEITLPRGWVWDQPNTKVGNAGTQRHTATFTPVNTKNYASIQKELLITVKQAMASEDMIQVPTLTEPYTYGIRLKELPLPEGWKWCDENERLSVIDMRGGQAYYEISGELLNYDWSNIYRYENGKVTRFISLNMQKATLAVEDFTVNEDMKQMEYSSDTDDVLLYKSYAYWGFTYIFIDEAGNKYSSPPHLGKYKVAIKYCGDDNIYETTDPLTDESWVIEVVKVRINEDNYDWLYDEEFDRNLSGVPYDGKEHINWSLTHSSEPGSDKLGAATVIYTYGEGKETSQPIDAGTYTPIKISFAEGENNHASVIELDTYIQQYLHFSIAKATLTAENFGNYFAVTLPENLHSNNTPKEVTVDPQPKITGMGDVTVSYYNNEGNLMDGAPVEQGSYTVKVTVEEGSNNEPMETELEIGTFTILASLPTHAITIDASITNGSVTADKTEATEGETVTLTVTPANGYERESLSYTYDGQTEAITGNTFTMPAAAVTVTATFKPKTVTPPVDPDPDPTPDPDPIYYVVTLPDVEGAMTDPTAGRYEVEEWDSFGFFLTLDADYDQSQPIVTTDRGETLEPRQSDGKYVIRSIRSDVGIRISGIVKNPDAVANESLKADQVKVWGGTGCLYMQSGTPQEVRVYTFSGSLLRQGRIPAGDSRWYLPAGPYIVRIKDKSYKAAVR